MRAVILHLSDIHFDSAEHPILERAEAISAAVRYVGLKFDVCFVAVTGDVAYSGKRTEYDWAKGFFRKLSDALHHVDPQMLVHYVFVPGNHDCNLAIASDVRQPEFIVPQLSTLNLNGDLLRHFVDVQTPFFEFAAGCVTVTPPGADRLFHTHTYTVGGKIIVFNCFNTAWLTQNPERPAKLYFPVQAIHATDGLKSADISISLFHHPCNWLEPSNAREFEQRVESISDLLLSGHEHTGDFYSKFTHDGGELRFIEAEPLWDSSVVRHR